MTPIQLKTRAAVQAAAPPFLGFALFTLLWQVIASQSAGNFPTPYATLQQAIDVFSDPFYRKSINDQGIGWNVLSSLRRVGIGFGLAALVGIPLGFVIGKDIAGKPVVADLAKMPHLLIAGRTGTGKSVCLNSIIVSILMSRGPDEVRMLMIDPKMVELSGYRKLPHLMHPVVTDMRKAEAILASQACL
mgnify:CR=1 FL=1